MLEPEDRDSPTHHCLPENTLPYDFPAHIRSLLSITIGSWNTCKAAIWTSREIPVEITLIDYGMTDDTDQFVTEIQIPVTSSDR